MYTLTHTHVHFENIKYKLQGFFLLLLPIYVVILTRDRLNFTFPYTQALEKKKNEVFV